MRHIRHINTGKYGMTSNFMIINYLNCLQKAATPLTDSSGRQRQAATNFDIFPKYDSLGEYSESHTASSVFLIIRKTETRMWIVSSPHNNLKEKYYQFNTTMSRGTSFRSHTRSLYLVFHQRKQEMNV